MGYRSDVVLLIKDEKIPKECDGHLKKMFDGADKRVESGEGVTLFLWEGRKWYSWFDDVTVFMDFLKSDGMEGHFRFHRIGEALVDNEFLGSLEDEYFYVGIKKKFTWEGNL